MNNISRIQGLDALGELKWLILSSNNIDCIEGLERLVQLSKLILSSNRIVRI
jgi:Leucine-rich repeat (LRR) protein